MHTITWLHLSDLHFQKNDEYNRGVVLDALWKDISERVERINSDLGKIDFICITGDIAYHGKTEEYELAIEQFFQPLLTHTGLDWEKLFIVPGNHDIVQSAVTSGAKSIGDALQTRDQITKFMSIPDERELIFKRLKNYFDFFRKQFQRLSLNEEFGYFYNAFPTVTTEKKVTILGLNSAWLCYGGEEDRGKLAVGEIQVDRALKQAENADIRLCLMHHPFEWLQENDDTQNVEFLLRKHCHFLLRGHFHRPNVKIESSLEGETIIIPAGAVYDKRESPLSYNFVCLNSDTGTGVVYLRRYVDERREWVRDIHSTGDKLDGQITFDLPKVLKNSARNSEPQIPAISVSPSHTTKQTDRPESLVNQTIQLLQENKIIGIAELLKKQSNAVLQGWEDVYNRQFSGQQQNVQESFEKLENIAEQILAIGLVCIEYVPLLLKRQYQAEEIYQRLTEVLGTLIRSTESWHGTILFIPFAIDCRLFYTWGAQCIACENLDFLKQMFSYQFPYKGDYQRLVGMGGVFHPPIHGNRLNASFDYVKEKIAAQSYLQESFPKLARNSLGYLCQFDLINCFRALKENTYLRLPNFLRFNKGQYEPLVLKILRNPTFTESLAGKIFNETRENFLANADERLANLRRILSKEGYSPILWDSLEKFTE